MKAFVYILFPPSLSRFYTGVTTLSLEDRIQNHIGKKYSTLNFTQKANDWQLFHFIACEDFGQARNIELHIKKMKSKIYIQNLTKYPDIEKKLLNRFRNQ